MYNCDEMSNVKQSQNTTMVHPKQTKHKQLKNIYIGI